MNAPATANDYISSLESDRQELVSAIRETVLANLDDGFVEIIDFGMIVYAIPLERYPDTYNGRPLMYAALASQKRYVSLYLMGVYADPNVADWFHREYRETGKRLDMGKSCVRFRKLDDVPFELIGAAIAQYDASSFIETANHARSRG